MVISLDRLVEVEGTNEGKLEGSERGKADEVPLCQRETDDSAEVIHLNQLSAPTWRAHVQPGAQIPTYTCQIEYRLARAYLGR